jgi:hypothetical protein
LKVKDNKMETNYEKLREKHKDVIENKAVQAIKGWRDNLHSNNYINSDEVYIEKAKRNIKSLNQKMDSLFND